MNYNSQDSLASIILLVIGIGSAALVLIFIGALGGTAYNLVESDIDAIYSSQDVNETVIASNCSWVALSYQELLNGSVGSLNYNWTIINATSGLDVSGNFTVGLENGTIRLSNKTIAEGFKDKRDWLNNSEVYVVYNYKDRTIRGHIQTSILSSFQSVNQVGSYLPIIVVALIITIILGLVIGLAIAPGYNRSGYDDSGAL